jgi:uncharacterized protein YbjT (DUF2867 family)
MARVVDVSNSPSFGDAAAAQEAAVGERHHVALSVVGTERVSGYFQPKIAPEKLIKGSSILYSMVHATQFFRSPEEACRHFLRRQEGGFA